MDLTPLSLAGQIVGSFLALVGIGASMFLLRQHRSSATASPAEDLTAQTPWRSRTAWAMAVCSTLVLVGVWIDPTVTPRLFLWFWMLVLTLVFVIFVIGGMDLLIVRSRAHEAKLRLVKQYRRELSHHTGGHQNNGQPPSQTEPSE